MSIIDKLLEQELDIPPLDLFALSLYRRIHQLEARLEALEEENNKLKQESRALEAENQAIKKAESVTTSDTGKAYVAWQEFEAAAIERFGRNTGWKAVVAYELEIDMKVLNAWKIVGIIPAELLGGVAALTKAQVKPASRTKWTGAERTVLAGLVAQGLDDRTIAKALSAQFGRRLIETSIIRARQRFKLSRSRR